MSVIRVGKGVMRNTFSSHTEYVVVFSNYSFQGPSRSIKSSLPQTENAIGRFSLPHVMTPVRAPPTEEGEVAKVMRLTSHRDTN